MRDKMLQKKDGPHMTARAIYKDMTATSQGIENSIGNYKKSGLSSDDMSAAMHKYIDRIYALSKIDHPDSLKLAYELIPRLIELSYNDNPCSQWAERPSDTSADQLLYVLATKRRENGEKWDYKETLEDLKESRDFLVSFGFEEAFGKCIELFESW